MAVPDFVQGCIAPTFTAFDEQGAFDETGQRNLLDFMARSKSISAYFVRSGMGQMYAFTVDEVKQLARVACEQLEGVAPVLVGCNGAWDRNYDRRPDPEVFLQECIALAAYAAEMGAAGVVYTLPEAIAPQDGQSAHDVVRRFFEAIDREAVLPVFIYQPPGTHEDYCLTPDLVRDLGAMEHIAGTKASYSDLPYVFSLIRAVRDLDFAFITGVETIFFATLYAGSRAVIGQGASVSPSVLGAVARAFAARDHERVLAAQEMTNRLVDGIGNAQVFLKRLATEQGFPVCPEPRTIPGSPYAQARVFSDDDYKHGKRLLAEALEQFPEPA